MTILLEQIRTEVNKVLEAARGGKLIGASLDAKVFLSTPNETLLEKLSLSTNSVEDPDRLYRVFLTSEVMSSYMKFSTVSFSKAQIGHLQTFIE